ncbi:MAG: PqqD family protein [Deltaproteobacteria bacterium]|nr:PqqD family protein [Deltaproteobacteria bacterium]
MTRSVQLSPEVLFRELQGEAVLLDLKSQRYFGLDLVGTRIWQLLSEHAKESIVLEHLELEFDAPREDLSRDLRNFLDRLESQELISFAALVSKPAGNGDDAP